MRILVVDDEEDIIDLISLNLVREGYTVISALTGEQALELVAAQKPDLIILNLMLPGIQGLDVCRYLRTNPDFARIPIIMLSAKTGEIDKILGLEIGADDYITKPFSTRELLARIRAVVRRTRPREKVEEQRRPFVHRDLTIDFEKYDVMVKGKRVDLTPTEMKLLFFLARNPGRVYSREQLLGHVWGEDRFVTNRSVDVHVSRIRKAIEGNPQKPDYILTVTSIGYKFDDAQG